MWEKLLGLFKETYGDDENYIPPSIQKRDERRKELASQASEKTTSEPSQSVDQGTLIGYNYLKGLDDEKDNDNARRFSNLSKLLRGKYENGKVEKTSGEPEENIRRKNT